MAVHLHLNADSNAVAANFARFFAEQLTTHTQDNFTVALSGGSTPKLLFQRWARDYADTLDWSRVHFFWGDERCVPPIDDDSNYGMTKALFFDHVTIPDSNIHRVLGEEMPFNEAIRYGQEIGQTVRTKNDVPRFDLIILGMGDDGHTASIFPHEMELLSNPHTCAVAHHPTSGQQRITLTGPVLNNAEQVAFLVTGAKKQEKVDAILNRRSGYEAYPAAHIRPEIGELHWFLDQGAYQ